MGNSVTQFFPGGGGANHFLNLGGSISPVGTVTVSRSRFLTLLGSIFPRGRTRGFSYFPQKPGGGSYGGDPSDSYGGTPGGTYGDSSDATYQGGDEATYGE